MKSKKARTGQDGPVSVANDALLPCPFCGGRARMAAWKSQREYSAYCTKCHAVAGEYRATEANAVKAWNRRVGK